MIEPTFIARIERGIRILEDHLGPALELPQVLAPEVVDLGALEVDVPRRGSIKAKQCTAEGRLARSGLTYHRQRLTPRSMRKLTSSTALNRLERQPQLRALTWNETTSESTSTKGASLGGRHGLLPGGDDARHLVSARIGPDLFQKRVCCQALFDRHGATSRERTAGCVSVLGWRRAGNGAQSEGHRSVGARDRLQQSHRVRVLRITEDLGGRDPPRSPGRRTSRASDR